MHLGKLLTSVGLGASLLASPLSVKAEEYKNFFDVGIGGYTWNSEDISGIFKSQSGLIKVGLGTRIRDNLVGKFSLGRSWNEEKVLVEKGVSGDCTFTAMYLEAELDYLIHLLETVDLHFGAGVSAMQLEKTITTEDFREESKSVSGIGIPVNVGYALNSNHERLRIHLNLGITLSPFEGVDVSGTYLEVGLGSNF
jgi:hypothetical protein